MNQEIQCPVASMAKQSGDAIALQGSGPAISYQALDAHVTHLTTLLTKAGLTRGQRLLVQVAPTQAHVVLLLACWRCGVTFVPMSPRLPETQRVRLVQLSQASSWVGPAPFTPPSSARELVPWTSLFGANWQTQTPPLEAQSPPAMWTMAQEATALLTSGSSAQPKAALHLIQNHYYSALGSNENIALEIGDQWLLSLPLFHVAGIAIVMRCLLAGATIVLPQEDRELLDHLMIQKPSHLSLVATQLSRLLQMGAQAKEALQSCKAILLGGSAIPQSLLKKSEALQLPLYTSYGATEMASQITTTKPGDTAAEWTQAGHLLSHRELRLGEADEIQVKGDTRFAGYLTPEGLERPFDEDGWFATGDLGAWGVAGTLQITGRKDSMFISGGENIQPEEIERVLEQHDDVEQVIVVDVPSPEFGARPCAFVKMRDQKRLRSGELRKFLKEHLASFKVPDRFFHWPQEAPSAGIKISRASLRKIAHRA